jgi:transposase
MPSSIKSQPSAAQTQVATLFGAVELSQASWLVALSVTGQDKIRQHRIAGGDAGGLLALLERVRRRAETALGGSVRVITCYEAGYDGFWLHRLLHQHGIDNHVLDAASLLVDRRARRAKTDRLDAQALLQTLIAWCSGNRRVCRVVRVPSPEEEDLRRRTRERERLMIERVQHVNRIKGLLFAQGITEYEPLRRNRRQRLDELRTGDGRALPEHLRAQVSRELDRLELLLEQIKSVETERDALLAAARSAATPAPAAMLLNVKGIGPECAGLLWSEGLFRHFDNRRQVASYAGLAPTPWQSGSVEREQGVSKAGNPRLRTMMIQLAWLWLGHQPHSALTRWFRERVERHGGRLRKTTIVALARKLLVALWKYVSAGIVIEGATMRAA